MRLDIGTTIITTAGTRVRLSADAGIRDGVAVLWASFRGRKGNTNEVYVGISDVTDSHGYELEAGGTGPPLVIPFRELGGSVRAGDFYFDADANNNQVDWALVLDD